AGKINVASFGVGTTSHLAGELFKAIAGISLVHVPYRGDALALTDTISGQVQATFSTVPASLEYVRTGKLRALGVTTATRWETLPDVLTHRGDCARLRSEQHLEWSRGAAGDTTRYNREA